MDEPDNPDIELEERSPGAPSRQQTLESQRSRQPLPWILTRLLGRFNVLSRPSGPVEDAIKAGAKLYRSDARSFISDFDRMSQRPKSRVQEIFDCFIRLEHMETESEATTGTLYHHVCFPLASDHC